MSRHDADKPTGWVYDRTNDVHHYLVEGVSLCSLGFSSAREADTRKDAAKGNCPECKDKKKQMKKKKAEKK